MKQVPTSWKEIIKIRAEINKIDTKKQSIKLKSCSFEKTK